MKKIIVLSSLMIFICSGIAFGQYPIPSYGVPVYHSANFQEKPPSAKLKKFDVKEKRKMNIRITALPNTHSSIWVYSLDGLDVLGPYEVTGSGLVSVDIDDREWGVYVESDDHVEVDVWTQPG